MLRYNHRLIDRSTVQNRFLAELPASDLALLSPLLRRVELKRHTVIFDANKPVDAVYFIESGLISRVARTQADGAVEAAMVGRSGLVGISAVLGTMTALHRTVVQIPGRALRIAADDLEDVMSSSPGIRTHLLHYVQVMAGQSAQIALCNAKHNLDQRLARWLLQAQDCAGRELAVTHELLATALGVGRSGVSLALADLEAGGVLAKARGALKIVSREELKLRSCECYSIIENAVVPPRALRPGAARFEIHC